MTKYKHLIFDLDHTLWDFEKSSRETLGELHTLFGLERIGGCSLSQFIRVYEKTNHSLWAKYHEKKVTKEELRILRFQIVFKEFGHNDVELAKTLDREYIQRCPVKANLMAGAISTLDSLSEKYAMHLLTNGFEETQHRKVTAAKINHYFNTITTSESSGHTKPHPEMFKFKLKKIQAERNECLMIGDNPMSDIHGAKTAGIDQVFFNPKGQHLPKLKPTFTISSLSDLLNFL